MQEASVSGESPEMLIEHLGQELARSTVDVSLVRSICSSLTCIPTQFRPKIWKLFLGVIRESDPLRTFNGVLDLEDQSVLEADVERLLSEIPPSSSSSSVASAAPAPSPSKGSAALPPSKLLQSIITIFLKRRGAGSKYQSEIAHIAASLFAAQINASAVFNCLHAFLNKYALFLFTSADTNAASCHLFRMLLQYHDPLLNLHLDQLRVPAETGFLSWLRSSFSSLSAPGSEASTALWDTILLASDPLLFIFFAIALLHSNRDTILGTSSSEELPSVICSLRLESRDQVQTLLKHASVFDAATPRAIRRYFHTLAFSTQEAEISGMCDMLKSCICLNIPVPEVVLPTELSFCMLDCRSTKAFRAARLPTAIHIGPDVRQDPSQFDEIRQRLEPTKGSGSHFCLFGTGRDRIEEENSIKFIVSQFIRFGFEHVSTAHGGYRACVPLMQEQLIELTHDDVTMIEDEIRSEAVEEQAAPAAPVAVAQQSSAAAAPQQQQQQQQQQSQAPKPLSFDDSSFDLSDLLMQLPPPPTFSSSGPGASSPSSFTPIPLTPTSPSQPLLQPSSAPLAQPSPSNSTSQSPAAESASASKKSGFSGLLSSFRKKPATPTPSPSAAPAPDKNFSALSSRISSIGPATPIQQQQQSPSQVSPSASQPAPQFTLEDDESVPVTSVSSSAPVAAAAPAAAVAPSAPQSNGNNSSKSKQIFGKLKSFVASAAKSADEAISAMAGDSSSSSSSSSSQQEDNEPMIAVQDLISREKVQLFQGKVMGKDGHLGGRYLAIGETHVLSLAPAVSRLGYVKLVWELCLLDLNKITYAKGNNQLATFVFRLPQPGSILGPETLAAVPKSNMEGGMFAETYFLPESANCTEVIRKNITKLKESIRLSKQPSPKSAAEVPQEQEQAQEQGQQAEKVPEEEKVEAVRPEAAEESPESAEQVVQNSEPIQAIAIDSSVPDSE